MGDPGLGLRRLEEGEGIIAISESGIQGTGPTCGSLWAEGSGTCLLRLHLHLRSLQSRCHPLLGLAVGIHFRRGRRTPTQTAVEPAVVVVL